MIERLRRLWSRLAGRGRVYYGGPDAELCALLIGALAGRISDPQRGASILETAEKFRRQRSDVRQAQLPGVYLLLEQFLVEVDADSGLTREKLRRMVRSDYSPLLELPRFALIFEPDPRQELLLCRELVFGVLDRAYDILGATGHNLLTSTRAWVESLPDGPYPTPPEELIATPRARTDEEWVEHLGALTTSLYETLVGKLGDAASQRVFQGAYDAVASTYQALDTFPVVIKLVPDELLDEQKVRLLSRNQIQRVLLDKVDNLQDVNDLLSAKNAQLARARAEAIAAREEAERANEAKSVFLSRMSHELRTPLNSVIGFTNILLKDKHGSLHRQDFMYLERIRDNGVHLLGLINDILDISKIEAGRAELEIEPVGLDDLVRETVHSLEGQVTERPIALTFELPGEVAAIDADRAKLKQVLINLVGNAIKFTETGSVTVRAEVDEEGLPTRVDVVDTGPGIPADRLEAVFEAFEQADNLKQTEGTGLGLAISRSLCTLMGFRLEVASTVGEGSTFTILLDGAQPAAAEAPEVAAREATPSPAAGEGTDGTLPVEEREDRAPVVKLDVVRDETEVTVLVIDDDADSRFLLCHYLEELGCRVLTADSGENGLRLAKEFAPDLITLDLILPGMQGWELLQRLKTSPSLREIPVIVVSVAVADNRGKVLGAVDLIDKPVERDVLIDAIRRNLDKRPGRALVIDDDPDAREILSSYLEDENLTVGTADNGREALDKLASFAPDLIILDLMMPVLDGLGFLEVVRADNRYLHIPVIVVTAKELTPEEASTLRTQTLGVLKKSEDLEERLRLFVEEALRRKIA